MTDSIVSGTSGSVYFYRETEHPYGFLSQWYNAPFTAPPPSNPNSQSSMTFLTTEQYMMYHKAITFGDHGIADKIMRANQPYEQKKLGRQVKGFDAKKWNRVREEIVEAGNWFKFTDGQGAEHDLGTLLLQTGERELIEACHRTRRE